MSSVAETSGEIKRLTSKELAALTQPARATTPEQKRAAVDRATRGLRVAVHVSPGLYRPR